MHPLIDRYIDTATPASRCLFAVAAVTPFFVAFWAFNCVGLFDAQISQGLNQGRLWALQAGLTLSIVLLLAQGWWLWPRRRRPERMPRAALLCTFNIGLVYMAVMIGAGALTTGTNVVLLGVLVIGLMLFEFRTMLIVFLVCISLYLIYDLLVMADVAPYAPLVNARAFEEGQPLWWLSLWRNAIFYIGWAAILTLILLLFSRLDALHLQLDKLSHTDVLTGLANRRYFLERMASERRRQKRTLLPSCLILLDVDHFKRINDRYGHHAGDEVLRRLAQVLIEGLRVPTDQPARIGGEEFAVLLPDTTLMAAETVCKRIAEALRQHEFHLKGERFHLTVSMGVVECRGDDCQAALKQADRNLYRAKQQGRDQAVYSMASEVDA
ncbi:MAG: GGDEF domain-containing protein [Rubrivivax sp.]|nr:MAG: GGDEF domain-containing protein [Rubrivivax sp.]